ncbi:hypothetical protein EV142_102121 [Flavobacterium circumlabens]|uniref:Uncharacterized protein n=1 Tax=Flavobacterium circumlabens TaxID=2133765 RepID=A0ABY2B101_9FLAO|nr:hypothetical protein EV142_102121 [Flavobacterium circumlabens]
MRIANAQKFLIYNVITTKHFTKSVKLISHFDIN